jgi:hypothetical protein
VTQTCQLFPCPSLNSVLLISDASSRLDATGLCSWREHVTNIWRKVVLVLTRCRRHGAVASPSYNQLPYKASIIAELLTGHVQGCRQGSDPGARRNVSDLRQFSRHIASTATRNQRLSTTDEKSFKKRRVTNPSSVTSLPGSAAVRHCLIIIFCQWHAMLGRL